MCYKQKNYVLELYKNFQHRFKTERHDFTEEIRKIALSSNYDKRTQQWIQKKHMYIEQVNI